MCKSSLQNLQKSPVDQAAAWADELVKFESRGPGDLENAMHRVARRHGLPHSIFWKLRYRRPKDVFASIYLTLQTAYAAECERQHRRLAHEVELTRAIAGAADPLVVAASAVVATCPRAEA